MLFKNDTHKTHINAKLSNEKPLLGHENTSDRKIYVMLISLLNKFYNKIITVKNYL